MKNNLTENYLEIKDLYVKNENFQLKSINLNLPKGAIMGLIGRNGVGKTTLIKAIVNQLDHTKGTVLFNGLPMHGNDVEVKSKIGIVFDDLLYRVNKPKKLVKQIAPFYKNFDMGKFNFLMDKFELDPNKNIAKYSKGMKTKFNVIMAICHNPDLLILDEPTEGLDPISRAEIMDLLLEMIQDNKKSVLFSTHIISDLEKIADYVTLMDKGEIIFSMDKESLIDTYALIQIDKSALTLELKNKIKGMKETLFGVKGLIDNKHDFEHIPGVKFAPATIEDIMLFQGRIKGND